MKKPLARLVPRSKYALLVLVIAALSLFLPLKRWLGWQSESERRAHTIKLDKEVLASAHSSEVEVSQSIRRLGAVSDPASRVEALKRINAPKESIRQAAAVVLGSFFEDFEAKEGLERLLRDSSVMVRVSALRALSSQGSQGGPARLVFLKSLERQKSLQTPAEILALNAGIAHFSPQTEQAPYLKSIATIYSKTPDHNLKLQALVDLMREAPRSPLLHSLIENDVLKSKDPQLQLLGINHISALRDKKLAEGFADIYSLTKEPRIRQAIVHSLSLACPSSRFSLIEKVIDTESDVQLRKMAFEQLRRLNGPDAETLAERLLANPRLKADERSLARHVWSDVKDNYKLADRCLF